MVSKLTAQDSNQTKKFKSKIYQGRFRGQSRNNYPDCTNCQNRYISDSGDKRTSYRGRGQYRQNYRGRPGYVNNYRNDFRRGNFREMQNYRGQNFRGGYRRNYRSDNFGRGRSRSRDRQYSGNLRRNDWSSTSRSRSGSRASTDRDRIKCFKYREYDHFTEVCPTLQVEKEPEQIQQMYNLDEEQTALKVLATDMCDSLIRASSNDTVVEHLNL